MKYAETRQTMIESIASDNISFVIENVEAGMSIDDAIEAQVDSAMNDPYDEDEFDAPFDRDQLTTAYEAAYAKEGN